METPLNDRYDKMLNSPIADMQNITNGRGPGSITAAQFLQRFVNKVPWAHLILLELHGLSNHCQPRQRVQQLLVLSF